MNRWLTGVAAVALLASIGTANAVPITDGSPALITYNVSQAVTGGNLTGVVTFGNFDFTPNGSNTNVTFTTTVKNTTTAQQLSDPASVRLTGFAYDVNPEATAASDTSGVYTSFLNANFPGGFQEVNVCLSVQTCAGGANGGLSPGQTDTFVETLTFTGAITTFDFGIGANEQLATKWQTGFGSFEGGTNPCLVNCGGFPPPPPPPPPGTVFEPSSMSLLGAGLLGFVAYRRRLRRKEEV